MLIPASAFTGQVRTNPVASWWLVKSCGELWLISGLPFQLQPTCWYGTVELGPSILAVISVSEVRLWGTSGNTPNWNKWASDKLHSMSLYRVVHRRLAVFGVTIMFYKATDAWREVRQFQVQTFIRVPYALSLRGSLVCTMCYPCATLILKSESFLKLLFIKVWKTRNLLRLLYCLSEWNRIFTKLCIDKYYG